MAKISIAMATFNGGRYLEQQLQSLAAQTYQPVELQIGDDGSTDATQSIVERFSASAPFPVHFVRNERRLGFGENFIRTAGRCSGEWIAFCDQDDVWHPKKLEWAAKTIGHGPSDLMLLAHNATVVDEALRGSKRLYHYSAGEMITPRLGSLPEWAPTGFTQVFRADLLRSIPSSRRVSFPWHAHKDPHDVWIALLANCTGSIIRSNKQLAMYRRHPATVTDQAVGPRPPLELTGLGYAERTAYLTEVAATLRSCIPGSSLDLANQLQEAAARMDDQARLLELRSQAYLRPHVAQRLAMIAHLLRAGAYVSARPWRFGPWRLIKDVLFSLRVF